jgi:leader peptidase (prepilin peptidase)/N-methyltransferase
MLFAMNIVIWVFVFAIGAVIGSFLNVLIYRLPRKLDFVRGSSFCPACEHKLGALDLIPIFSYLALGRKCRWCGAPISVRYPLIELAGGALALVTWLAFVPNPSMLGLVAPPSAEYVAPEALLAANTSFLGPAALVLAALLYFCVLCILLVVTCIDADTMEIPDGLNVALLICGVAAIFVAPEIPLLSRGIGLICVSLPLFLIAFIIPGAFGGGDIKLMAAAGVLLGWQSTLVAALIGILIGGIWGVYLMATRKKGRKEHIAFGPPLCAGIAIALFLAPHIITWYLSFF